MNRNILTVPVQRVEDDAVRSFQDLLAVEEPLEIRVGERVVSVTMRTPGHDFELAAGFLFTEGILESSRQIRAIRHREITSNPRQAGNSVLVELEPGFEIDLSRLARNFYITSSCGVCGKASIDAIEAAGCPAISRDLPVIPRTVIHRLPRQLRAAQSVFERTGGLHAAALFDTEGKLLNVREDVGRHNALDKLIGAEMLAGRTPCSSRIILISSRASFELVQKTVLAGVPVLAAVGAPSTLAVEVAQRFGITLLGFVRDNRFNIYSGAWRIQ